MVRQFQGDYYGGVRSESALEHMPDFVKLADAYGLPGYQRELARRRVDGVRRRAVVCDGPILLHFSIDPDANVYPIVPLGAGLTEFQELPDVYA